MDESIYDTYYHLEREHWWFQARKEIVFGLLEQHYPKLAGARVLDIGSGTGSYLEELGHRGIEAEGHDASPQAIAYLSRCTRAKLAQKKFPEDYQNNGAAAFDVVLLLDVLEHIDNDRWALETALKLVKPGGILFCTVPACKAMWGPYDIVSHHFRRYTLREFRSLVDSSPLKIKKMSYFSFLLFPGLFLIRVVESLLYLWKHEAVYRPHLVRGFINKFFYSIFRLERRLLKRWDLPFGSSLLAVLEKKNSGPA